MILFDDCLCNQPNARVDNFADAFLKAGIKCLKLQDVSCVNITFENIQNQSINQRIRENDQVIRFTLCFNLNLKMLPWLPECNPKMVLLFSSPSFVSLYFIFLI